MVIQPIDPLELLNTKQMAARAGVSDETPEMWRKRKKGPPFVKIGRTVRYRTVDVVAWLEAHTVDPAETGAGKSKGKPAPNSLQNNTGHIPPHLRGRGMRGFA